MEIEGRVERRKKIEEEKEEAQSKGTFKLSSKCRRLKIGWLVKTLCRYKRGLQEDFQNSDDEPCKTNRQSDVVLYIIQDDIYHYRID